jgi:hypothetical protein
VTFALAILLAAQIGGTPISGGNPTPGTPQPQPPNVGDRITVTGCVELAKGASAGKVDGNEVIDSRYVLTTVSTPSKVQYKLAGIEGQLSPFVGAKVEISGEPKAPASNILQVEFVQRLASHCR